jgi:hypothetical protein
MDFVEPLRTNVDLLSWFAEDERHVCLRCGTRSAVTVADALASFCLECGAISIDGVPMEIAPERAA